MLWLQYKIVGIVLMVDTTHYVKDCVTQCSGLSLKKINVSPSEVLKLTSIQIKTLAFSPQVAIMFAFATKEDNDATWYSPYRKTGKAILLIQQAKA